MIRETLNKTSATRGLCVEDQDESPEAVAREMLVALCVPNGPKVLSKIGWGQAVFDLHSSLQSSESDPSSLHQEGRNICTTFPHIAHSFSERFENAVERAEAVSVVPTGPKF